MDSPKKAAPKFNSTRFNQMKNKLKLTIFGDHNNNSSD